MEIKNKLVTVEQVKYLSGNLQTSIDDVTSTAEENAQKLATLKSTSDTHTTDIATLKATDTTIQNELTDIRKGYDNTAYASAGEAVRRQIKDIKDSVATMAEFKEYLETTVSGN